MHYARIGRSNPLTWSPPSADRPPFLKNTQSQPSRFFVPHKWGPHFKCTTVEGDPAFPRAGEGHGGSPLEYGAKPSRNFFGTPKKRGGWAWVRGRSARGPSDGAHANHRGGRSAAGPVSKVTAGYLAVTRGVTVRYLTVTWGVTVRYLTVTWGVTVRYLTVTSQMIISMLPAAAGHMADAAGLSRGPGVVSEAPRRPPYALPPLVA